MYLGAHCEWTCTDGLSMLFMSDSLIIDYINTSPSLLCLSSLSLPAYTTLDAIFVLFQVRLFTKCTSTKRTRNSYDLVLYCMSANNVLVVKQLYYLDFVYVDIVVCYVYNQYRDPVKQCSIFSTDITFYGIGLYRVGVRVQGCDSCYYCVFLVVVFVFLRNSFRPLYPT